MTSKTTIRTVRFRDIHDIGDRRRFSPNATFVLPASANISVVQREDTIRSKLPFVHFQGRHLKRASDAYFSRKPLIIEKPHSGPVPFGDQAYDWRKTGNAYLPDRRTKNAAHEPFATRLGK